MVVETSVENTIKRSSVLVMPELTLGPEYVRVIKDYIDEHDVNHGKGTVPEISDGPVSSADGHEEANSNRFFTSVDSPLCPRITNCIVFV